MTINDITLVALYECLFSTDNLEKHGITPEEWAEIKANWEKDNPIESEEFERAKGIYSLTAQYNTAKVMRYYLYRYGFDEETWRLAFYPPVANEEEAIKYCDKHTAKFLKLIQLETDILNKYMKEKEERPKPEAFNLQRIYDTIASVEGHGHVIENYDTLKYTKYLAITRRIERVIQEQKRSSGRR